MPIPPATNTYDSASSSTKWLRGSETVICWPGLSWVCTTREPPREAGSLSTPMR